MPKATVYKDRNFPRRKNNVRISWQVFPVNAESVPSSKKCLTNNQLGLSVCPLMLDIIRLRVE